MRTFFLLFILFLSLSSFAQTNEQSIDGTKLFANAVATDGEYAVVGNMWQTGTLMGHDYLGAGRVSVYKILPNGDWIHFQDIDEPSYFAYENNPIQAIGLYYGCSVDIDDGNIIVGAFGYDSDMSGDIGPDGMAFIYSYDDAQDLFVKVATLAPEVEVLNEFGWSVAISGDWAVVGDPSEEHPLAGEGEDRDNIGCAHVYHFNGVEWNHNIKLTASNGWGSPEAGGIGAGDEFGYSVAVDGDVIAIGAPNQGIGAGSANGAVYIYEWDGANWTETFLQADVPVESSRFGSAVGVSGDYMVSGAPGVFNGAFEGYISLFHNDGNWAVNTTQSATDSQAGNMFGASVSIIPNKLIVGAYGFNTKTGKVYTYDYTQGMFETRFEASDKNIGDEFGYSCGLAENTLIVGAQKTERNHLEPAQEGTAYFYPIAVAFGGLWTGAVNSDWGNPNNWQDNNVPNGFTDVLIDALAPNQPLIDNMVANCKNLTIMVGATVTISFADGVLNVNGDLNQLGQILFVAKSKDKTEYNLTVLGVTTFGGDGQQDIPGGNYQDFHYDCGANSIITGDVIINGDFHHDNNYKLTVGSHTLSLGGQIWGTQRKIIFNQNSNLILFGDRESSFYLPSNISKLNNFTIDIPGNEDVYIDSYLTVHGQLSLLDGDVFMGFSSDVQLTLFNPILNENGRLLSHPFGGKSSMIIMDNGKDDDEFYIPASLTELSAFWISRTAPTLLSANLQVNDLYALYTATFDVNGFEVLLGDEADMWIGGDAQITEEMVGGDGIISGIEIESGSPTFDFDVEVEGDFNIGSGAGQVQIAPGRCITVNGTTTIGANLILSSDASGSACFIDNGPLVYPNSKVDANIIVESYIPSKEEWHYVSSPVKNSTAESFAGAYLNAYDTEQIKWIPFSSLNQSLNTMQGYSAKLPADYSGQKIEFSGELNTAQSAPLLIDLIDGGDAYNLVGNPFPSSIDWDNENWTMTNIANAIYIWNAGTGSYTSYVDGVGVNGGTRYIAAMQGFFVEAIGSNPSLQIDNNDVRVPIEATFLKSENEIQEQLRITLANDSETDEVIIRFVQNSTSGFDNDYDARKLFGKNSLAQIYIENSDMEKQAIQSLSSIKETDFVSIGLQIEEPGEYELNFEWLDSFTDNVTIALEDKKENSFMVLENLDSYPFNYQGMEESNRFVLHFKDVTAIDKIEKESIKTYFSGGIIYISNTSDKELEWVKLYNMAGQLMEEVKLSNQQYERIEVRNLEKGVYVVQLTADKEQIQQKIVIN